MNYVIRGGGINCSKDKLNSSITIFYTNIMSLQVNNQCLKLNQAVEELCNENVNIILCPELGQH